MNFEGWNEDKAMCPEAEAIAETLAPLTEAQKARVLAEVIAHDFEGGILMRLSGRWMQEIASYIAEEQDVSLEKASMLYGRRLLEMVGEQDVFSEDFEVMG